MRTWLTILWHPHQKLWNWDLMGRIRRRLGGGLPAQTVEALVLLADSLLLAARSRARRGARQTGPRGGTSSPGRPRVLYIDCGLHKDALQVEWMQRWFGERYELHILAFEAGVAHARDAEAKLAGLERLRLHNLALVGPDHEGDSVRLYRGGGKGKADSLLRERGENFELVPARRLSAVLADEGWDLARTPTVLRMNIEGAEHFVIEDLLAAGLAGSIDGYYGMWDDLSKIDPAADAQFQSLLAQHGISTLTFNDRDLATPKSGSRRFSPRALPAMLRGLAFQLRQHTIRADIESAYAAGITRASAGTP